MNHTLEICSLDKEQKKCFEVFYGSLWVILLKGAIAFLISLEGAICKKVWKTLPKRFLSSYYKLLRLHISLLQAVILFRLISGFCFLEKHVLVVKTRLLPSLNLVIILFYFFRFHTFLGYTNGMFCCFLNLF